MLIVVCLLGIVAGLLHRRRAERPFTIMVASLALLALVMLADRVIEEVIYRLFRSVHSGGGIIDTLHKLWYWPYWLVQAVAVAGLIFAALFDRGFDVLNFSAPVSTTSGQVPPGRR